MKPSSDTPCIATVTDRPDGGLEVALRGRLDARSTTVIWRQMRERLTPASVRAVRIAVDGLEHCDGAGIALLRFLNLGGMTGGATVEIAGLKPAWRGIFEAVTAEDVRAFQGQPFAKPHVVEEVGRWGAGLLRDLREQVAFTGEAVLGLVACLRTPRAMRWAEVTRVFEVAGANALPIVSLISLLVGLIIAFSAVQPLAQFGAQIYIANMIGLIMVRELGPIMTAIMLAGRSGSAFAAELGTMKVNEELNALVTMGLDPMRFLVVQRLLAGVLLTPLLTLYSMFMGIAGGVIVMLAIGFSFAAIWNQLTGSLVFGDILVGAVKGIAFGALVSGVGCLRGMQTKKGPSAVGESTTRAVVSGILLIIIADAVFAVLLYVLKL
jgi:phospholipid/cholesterol/gamma-HCH transport system permease protein